MHKVTIGVTGDGKAVINFDGFVGTGCTTEQARLRELLAARGVDIAEESIVFKPEYDLAVVEEEASRRPSVRQTETEG
jgi:hypothetical protein